MFLRYVGLHTFISALFVTSDPRLPLMLQKQSPRQQSVHVSATATPSLLEHLH